FRSSCRWSNTCVELIAVPPAQDPGTDPEHRQADDEQDAGEASERLDQNRAHDADEQEHGYHREASGGPGPALLGIGYRLQSLVDLGPQVVHVAKRALEFLHDEVVSFLCLLLFPACRTESESVFPEELSRPTNPPARVR